MTTINCRRGHPRTRANSYQRADGRVLCLACRAIHRQRHWYFVKRYCLRPAVAVAAIGISILGHPLPFGRVLNIGIRPAAAAVAMVWEPPKPPPILGPALPPPISDEELLLKTYLFLEVGYRNAHPPVPPPPPRVVVAAPRATPRPVVTSVSLRGTEAQGQAMVAEARRQIGKPYVWGGNGPYGFDCSGLVIWAMGVAGLGGLGRTTYAQYRQLPHITLDQAHPGDLIFMNGIGHVTIYAGNGMMIEAPHSGLNVREVPVRAGSVGQLVYV